MSRAIIVQTTSNDKSVLAEIAAQLIDQKLAACCQISGPVESHYRWKEAVEMSHEWLLNIKTVEAIEQKVYLRVSELHNYDLPEIVSIEMGGDPKYLRWIREQVDF